MHYFSHPRLCGTLEEDFTVLNGLTEGHAIVLESNPVGVVKPINTLQCLHEIIRTVEIVRKGLYFRAKRIWLLQVGRDGFDSASGGEQGVGDVTTNKAKRASYNVGYFGQPVTSRRFPQRNKSVVPSSANHDSDN
jgi:hypothetical protein